MNKPFDLFVFIVLVAAYFVFRISLTPPRSDRRETGSDENPDLAPETRFTASVMRHSGRQMTIASRGGQLRPSRTTATLARSRAADKPSFRVQRKPKQTGMPRHSGSPLYATKPPMCRPVRLALAAGKVWD